MGCRLEGQHHVTSSGRSAATQRTWPALRQQSSFGSCNALTASSSRQSLRYAGVVEGLKATAVAAGRCTSLAVGLDGEVYSWGCNRLGRAASGDAQALPGQVQGFGRLGPLRRAVGLAAGEYSSVVVTETGEVRDTW